MSNDEAKLKFFGLIKTAAEREQELDYSAVADMLETDRKVLKRWATEFKKKTENETALSLIDVDSVMIDRIAEELEREAAELDAPKTQINPVTGHIEVIKPDTKVTKQRNQKIESFRNGVEGLQLLNEEVQATAGTIVHKIMDAVDDDELSTRDLAALTKALTDVQNAFFNKPTTNVQVNTIQQNGEGETLLSAFKERLKP